ncbi:MAG: hypothetical protein ABIL09_27585 [Gemmatimonadota bacterium]
MTTTGRILLAALCTLLLWPDQGGAGEAFVTRVRGASLTFDKGAEEGLEVGMTVTVVRPPDEPIIHPLTGENMGAPEIELGTAEITRVAPRAASARMSGSPLLAVRPGDVARFTTIEEKMMLEQQQATESNEKATAERQAIRGEASRLAKDIRSIQSTIRGLEGAITELRRFDKDVVQPQFRSINKDIEQIKEELSQLRVTVNLLGSAPVQDIGEGEAKPLTDAELQQLRTIIDEEVKKLQDQLAALAPPPPAPEEMPPPELPTDGLEEDLGVKPFYEQIWFFGALAAVGVAAIGFYLFTRMQSGGGADDEDEGEDDEMELDDEGDEDVEVEVEEEEDDIVVEETS